MHTLQLLCLILMSASIYAQTPCDKSNMNFPNGSFILKPVRATVKDVKRQLGGTVRIVDGCSFQVSGMLLNPAGQDVYFYGIPKGQPSADEVGPNGVTVYPRIVSQRLASYDGQNLQFTLNGVSWSDMDGISIYSEGDKATYMTAQWAPTREESSAEFIHISVFALISSVLIYLISI